MPKPIQPRKRMPTILARLAIGAALATAACDSGGDSTDGDDLRGAWMITSHTYAQGDCSATGQPVAAGYDIALLRDLPSAGAGALEFLVCRDAAGTDCDGLSGDYVRPLVAGGYGAETYVAQWTGSECVGTRRTSQLTLAAAGDTFHFDASTIQGAVPGASDEAGCTLDAVEAASTTASWPCVSREIIDAEC